MAYVPGFQPDVFISYAHGDDRAWIGRFVERLRGALDRRLGTPVTVWLDDDDNRRSRDFSREIPENVREAAVFLLLASPSYIRSAYCVDVECQGFAGTLDDRRARFATPEFTNELFAFRCPVLPVDNNEHWTLFPGLTDIPFCNDSTTFEVGSAEFETSFERLTGELATLLKRMRNQSTSVFLYPPAPTEDIQAAHTALIAELTAQSYRVLPDRRVNLAEQLRESSLSVFLLGDRFDERAEELVAVAAQRSDRPWVAWCAPGVENTDALGFAAHVEQLDSPSKTYLNAGTLATKLKEEVLALLKPPARPPRASAGLPRVYLVYNARDAAERRNAGLISFTFRREIQFEHPDDPAQHTRRLADSDGVLLVWGNADEEWSSREFLEIVQAARRPEGRGLCVFDPRETKVDAIAEIKKTFGDQVYVGEQFGPFDPTVLDPFFTPIRRRVTGAAR